MHNTDTTALLEALALIRQTAVERMKKATTANNASHALPAGTKGRRKIQQDALAELEAAREQVQVVLSAIRQANAGKARTFVDDALRSAQHLGLLIGTVIDASRTQSRACVLRVNDLPGVYVRVSTDDWGIPTSVEVERLATPEQTIEQARRWLAKATDDETRAKCQAIIDDPASHPTNVFGPSVTVSRSWRGDVYSVNASTWRVESDDDEQHMLAIQQVAIALRRELNKANLPTFNQVEDILEGNG